MAVQLSFQFRQLRVELPQRSPRRCCVWAAACSSSARKRAQRTGLRLQLPSEVVVLLQAQADAQFLQPVGVFLVALGLGRLQPHAAQLLLDLVEDVLGALQVLLDAFQLAQRFDLLGLEAADAGRLLEDGPAVLGATPAAARRPGPAR